MKICSICNNEKEYSEFHRCKGKKDGYKSACKICRNTQYREYSRTESSKKLAVKRVAKYRKTKKGKLNIDLYNKSVVRKESLKKYNQSAKRKQV